MKIDFQAIFDNGKSPFLGVGFNGCQNRKNNRMECFKMLLARVGDGKTTESFFFDSMKDLIAFSFSPEITVYSVLSFSVHGRTYKERKADAERLAIDFSIFDCYGLSLYEVNTIQSYFEKIGKRYGLISDFRENLIC